MEAPRSPVDYLVSVVVLVFSLVTPPSVTVVDEVDSFVVSGLAGAMMVVLFSTFFSAGGFTMVVLEVDGGLQAVKAQQAATTAIQGSFTMAYCTE